jgi:hypothetical protein
MEVYSKKETSAGIFKQSMGARNPVGIGLSYRPARLHRLAAGVMDSLESILGLLKFLKIQALCLGTGIELHKLRIRITNPRRSGFIIEFKFLATKTEPKPKNAGFELNLRIENFSRPATTAEVTIAERNSIIY